MDLRCTLPGLYNPHYSLEPSPIVVINAGGSGGRYKSNLNKNATSLKTLESVYCSIEPKEKQHLSVDKKSVMKINSMRASHPLSFESAQSSNYVPHFAPVLARNCISLEDLDNITTPCMQNDLEQLHSYNSRQQRQDYLTMLALWQQQQYKQSAYNFNNIVYGRQPMGCEVEYPPSTESQLLKLQSVSNIEGLGYSNYTNPYITANSKLSLGNESDDYRRYRDVAL